MIVVFSLATACGAGSDENGGGSSGHGGPSQQELCYGPLSCNGDTVSRKCFATPDDYCASLCSEGNCAAVQACQSDCLGGMGGHGASSATSSTTSTTVTTGVGAGGPGQGGGPGSCVSIQSTGCDSLHGCCVIMDSGLIIAPACTDSGRCCVPEASECTNDNQCCEGLLCVYAVPGDPSSGSFCH